MSELGRLLSEARTAKELTLSDVENVTRIRQKYLEALENGNYSALPHGATSRGFLRNYARFLGLDTAEALRLYTAESGDAGQEIPVDQGGQSRTVDYRPLEVELINEEARGGWQRWAVIAVVVVLVVGSGGWGIWSGRLSLPRFNWSLNWPPKILAALGPVRLGATPTSTATATPWVVKVTPTPPAAPPDQGTQALPTSDLLTLPTPTVQPTVTPTPKPTATPEVVDRIALHLRISQDSWVMATVDGQVVEQGLLNPGQERDWQAQSSITLRTGNAAGVSLTLNGKDLGTMGDVGQVVERTWVNDKGNVTEATPPVTGLEATPGADQTAAAPATTLGADQPATPGADQAATPGTDQTPPPAATGQPAPAATITPTPSG